MCIYEDSYNCADTHEQEEPVAAPRASPLTLRRPRYKISNIDENRMMNNLKILTTLSRLRHFNSIYIFSDVLISFSGTCTAEMNKWLSISRLISNRLKKDSCLFRIYIENE
jgi:hypothetical protein